jgi:hypothetical protein
MIPDAAPRETLMDPQQVTLQVVMVDDEEALCRGVRRIIERYKVHVADVLVDAAYASARTGQVVAVDVASH